ncbi:MAG: hypothetical protein HYR64_05950 [Fimbriimonas ginsengisoli]|uniref:Uncharacterized protein n=1 Tax=Fimbriimonas ginsengisoli TaxID=1005039 RepID=A0A931LUY3_FIMGI|nr:hypothetical protein [Fimbriimonas ginsengisoli]
MTKRHHCRIDGILATQANQAVIFRRGPNTHYQLSVWDLNADAIEKGQWLLVGKIYTRRSDVSPDGRYLVIAATDYRRGKRARDARQIPPGHDDYGWTAVSRPPYFAAIALWFTGCSWNGGGIWRGNRELRVNNSEHSWYEAIAPPPSIATSSLGHPWTEDEPIFSLRLGDRGWQVRRKEEWEPRTARSSPWITTRSGIMEKPFQRGCLRRETTQDWERWSVVDDSGVERRSWKPEEGHPQWVDVNKAGRIVFGENGCLWAWDAFPDGEPALIADLNDQAFECVSAPDWAKEW